ncbi:MAG: signal recognition particle-docking protein FtsY [Nanoarchaeota archaeon]
MFGFLKNKLKEAISKFSKKVEEEAKPIEETKIEEVREEPVKIIEEKLEVKEEISEKQPEIKEEVVEEEFKEEIKEKKGFFGIFKKKKEEFKEEKPEIKQEKQEIKEEKGFFSKITQKLTTKTIDEKKFNELFEDLELVLLENNVALEVVDKIKEDLKLDLVDVPLKGNIEDLVRNFLKQSLEKILKESDFDLVNEIKNKENKPYVIVFAGINGSGKTTTTAKIARLCQDNKLSVVLGAADSFRSAAVEQLEEWGNRLKAKVIKNKYGSDPASICFDTISYAKSHGIDVVLLDTAGRQHSNKNLMEEMKKIIKVAKPDLKIFIGESIVGNDSIFQSQEFNKSIGIDGVILTKSDVDEKGGAIISISYVIQKPIIYLGSGQNLNDLEKFNKDKIIKGLGF